MAEGPRRRTSFSAALVASAEEAGALKADRQERQRELRQNPEMIEQPPMRRRPSGQWRYQFSVHEGEVKASPAKVLASPAGSTGMWDDGPLGLMLRPWRLLAGYQFDNRIEDVTVAGRDGWLLRGSTRIVEPLFDHFVRRWARASDSAELAIDKETGIALSITANFAGSPWYRAELHDFGSRQVAIPEDPIDAQEDDPQIVDVAEAVKRLQFKLYLPDRVPRESRIEIQVNSAGTWAGVSIERSDFQWRVLIRERPIEDAADEDLDQWERLNGTKGDSWVWDRSTDPAAPAQRWQVVRTERTHISLYSTLPRPLLSEVAESLKPLV